MKSLLLSIVLLTLLLGCVAHEPTYYTIYTPTQPLTNSQPAAMSVTNSLPQTGS